MIDDYELLYTPIIPVIKYIKNVLPIIRLIIINGDLHLYNNDNVPVLDAYGSTQLILICIIMDCYIKMTHDFL